MAGLAFAKEMIFSNSTASKTTGGREDTVKIALCSDKITLYSDKSPNRILPGAANVVENCGKNPQNRQQDPTITNMCDPPK